MPTLLHLYIAPKSGVTRAQVEEKLNLAVDWYRYHPRCYVVFTTSEATKWQKRLLPLVETEGRLFICELNPTNYQGLMDPSFWSWLNLKLGKGGKDAADIVS
jgi:hypothetical protein